MSIPLPQAGAEGKSAEVQHDKPLTTVGIVADTHIPDRVSELHPRILPTFEEAGVSHILHAGDICIQRVIDELAQVAPVTGVRGNRDLVLPNLPLAVELNFAGVPVALMHGHGGWKGYVVDKVRYYTQGYNLPRYLRRLSQTLPDAKVVIFGHTHHIEMMWYQGKLLFNPGSASFGFTRFMEPSVGLLHIYPGGSVKVEVIPLKGYTILNRKWQPVSD